MSNDRGIVEPMANINGNGAACQTASTRSEPAASVLQRNGHFAALILARGGSKGIKLKNIRSLAGQPLVTWALRAAIDSKVFNSVWVSTDHDDIARVAQEWGAKVFRRGAWSARDCASSSESIKEFLDVHTEVEMVAHVQCTSPCLHPWHFLKPVEMIRQGQYDSVFSVTRLRMFRWEEIPTHLKHMKREGIETRPLNFDAKSRPKSPSEWRGELFETGAFYMTTRHAFMDAKCTQGGRSMYYEMDPKYSVDIDTEVDWMLAEERIIKFGYFGNIQPQGVKLAVFCMEGVLMDNQFFSVADNECRSYNIKDAMGIRRLLEEGVVVRIISETCDPMHTLLANKLGLTLAVEPNDKAKLLEEWREELEVNWNQIAFMGRGMNDIDCIMKAGVCGAPVDSEQDVQLSAKFVAKQRGGSGAVREFCDHVMLVTEKAKSFIIQTQNGGCNY